MPETAGQRDNQAIWEGVIDPVSGELICSWGRS
jgi:hypothetical protein